MELPHVFPDQVRARAMPPLGEFGVDLIVVDHVAAVPVEQQEYSLIHRSQGTRLAGDHNPMSAAVDITGLIERIRERDFPPQRSHNATVPPPTVKAPDSSGGMADWSFIQAGVGGSAGSSLWALVSPSRDR
jgi:hypothetical protein